MTQDEIAEYREFADSLLNPEAAIYSLCNALETAQAERDAAVSALLEAADIMTDFLAGGDKPGLAALREKCFELCRHAARDA